MKQWLSRFAPLLTSPLQGEGILRQERPRWFLWSPVAMMAGSGLYFALPDEPPAFWGMAAMAITLAALGVLRQSSGRFMATPLLLVSLGFTACQLRAHIVATPLLDEEIHNREVTGTIDEIEPVEAKEKLVLSHLSIEGIAPEATPLRVRVSFRASDPELRVGDRVRLTANLYPLPQPVMPGSYDFARHFYFRSIGGNGYALRPAQRLGASQDNGLHAWLNNLRHAIGEDMRSGMPGEAGTVAAAMTVGETGPIPSDVKAALRDSGLAHMLAIAGLHLGIVTAIVFYNIRLLLTLWPRMAMRLPVKKIAAVFALISAFIYLVLAGEPIPAQRAFIMVVFLFTSILLDRKAVTLRTLAIAAMIVLVLFPESMLGPSFQMSFAATLAIVALYESFGRKLHGGATVLSRAWAHVLGITITSLVATLATSPFVLYHFNRFAIFGLLSNMIVVPLATFVIMPGMVLALLLMPFGLQAIGYVPLAFGTNVMIAMARWVISLPYASIHLPSPSDTGLMIAAFGLLWLCLMVGRHRFLGLAIIALGLGTIAKHVPVDVLIAGDAHQVMVRLDNGHYTALKGTMRSYVIQNWLRSEGEDELVPLKETAIACDKTLCTYQPYGRTLLLVKKPDDDAVLQAACAKGSDVLVAWKYVSAQQCPGAHLLIGRSELETYGSYALWFSKSGVRASRTRDINTQRIWQPAVKIHIQDDDNL